LPVKKENKRLSYTATPYYRKRLERISEYEDKSKTQLINMWIDQYYMAFGHDMEKSKKKKKSGGINDK